jgi:hypothetical protein
MIKSVISDSLPLRYVYFSNEGTITKISSRTDSDSEDSWATFKISDVMPFIDGSYRFSDYLVNKNTNDLGYSIVKKRVDVKSRAIESQIKKVSACKDAEIVIVLKQNRISISASARVIEKDISSDQEVMIAGKSNHPFFITMKDRPDFILKEVLVPYNILLVGDTFSEPIPYNSTAVSIYTRPYFNTYSLET